MGRTAASTLAYALRVACMRTWRHIGALGRQRRDERATPAHTRDSGNRACAVRVAYHKHSSVIALYNKHRCALRTGALRNSRTCAVTSLPAIFTRASALARLFLLSCRGCLRAPHLKHLSSNPCDRAARRGCAAAAAAQRHSSFLALSGGYSCRGRAARVTCDK